MDRRSRTSKQQSRLPATFFNARKKSPRSTPGSHMAATGTTSRDIVPTPKKASLLTLPPELQKTIVEYVRYASTPKPISFR